MHDKLVITADRDEYIVGLKGGLFIDGFSGHGEGWYNNSDVKDFCGKLLELCETMSGKVELMGAQSKADGSECLELFCIRVYTLNSSKLNGVVGVHVTLSAYPYTDCRPEEILKVSGEIKARNHQVVEFAKDLNSLLTGSVNEVCLLGGNSI